MLGGDAQTICQAPGVAVADGAAQVFAFQVFHHDVGTAAVFAVIEHADDVFVLDAAGDLGFVQEARLWIPGRRTRRR